MAKAKAKAASGKQGGGSLMWLQGLACGGLAALVPGIALQVGILLLPAIAALILDREHGKPVARAVLLCTLAASVEPMRALWNSGQGADLGFSLVADLHAITLTWSAAAGGWLLTQVIPVAVGMVLGTTADRRSTELQEARARLMEEWGLAPPADQ